MARRVTWTNNSTGYDGTNIYRDTTIDPQNLPEPIATVDPVAQGATVEYIDLTGSGDQCYAVRDFDSSGDGALSDAYCFEETTDWSQVSIGDEVEGGIYAGDITYADAREFHIIMAKQSGELDPGSGDTRWQIQENTQPGADDVDDGLSNTEALINSTDGIDEYPAGKHCVNYSNDGFDDFYLPAPNEIAVLENLVAINHSEIADPSQIRWTSRETSSSNATSYRLSDGATGPNDKNTDTYSVRPIRRVPV